MTFEKHLEKYLSKDEINHLVESLQDKPQHAVLLNPSKMSDETFLSLFPKVKPHPIVKHAYLYDKDVYDLGKSNEHELGAFYLQDPSAMTVSGILDLDSNDTVLDLCAAPGGKSIQASFKMNNQGLIISNDISHSRAMSIKENVERLGNGNILIISNDFSKVSYRYQNAFSKIILDAPCSGSGMFRKNQLVKDDWTYEKVLKYQGIQKDLILLAYQMLAPGGILSYSTCSFSYEEDEDVIFYLLGETNATIHPIANNPHYFVSSSGLGVHLFPHLFPGEGHYICQIQKPGHVTYKDNPNLANSSKRQIPYCPYTLSFGDFLYGVSQKFDISLFSIIRYGVKIGEPTGDVIKYDLHYARYIPSFNQEIEINEEELQNYFKGYSLNKVYPSGFVLIKYHGLNLDIGKSDGRIIKNRYPKYLRKK